MNKYGLTDEEKMTHLQKYNHALFKNSLSFMDIVWEINIIHKTIVVLEDKLERNMNKIEFLYEEFYGDCISRRIPDSDRKIFGQHMPYAKLAGLQEEVSFSIHLLDSDGAPLLHKIVLTPAVNDDGQLYCVYFGALNIQDEEEREMDVFRNQEQFREALMANCYFHFEFDVTEGGIITEDFEARDGSHPIREATGRTTGIPYGMWVDKWYELYEPVFDKQQEDNIFSIDYFKEAFTRNERLLDVEVKQKSQVTGQTEYMHIFVVLLENPGNKHIHACIIWRDITPFRSGVIEDRINLKIKNEELERTISKEEQFRIASLSGAIMVYNINLTRNLIENEFYEIVEGRNYPILRMVGLEAPCNFDTFCRRWCETKVPKDSRDNFLQTYNRQYLLDAYERGEQQIEIEFDTVIGRGIPITLRNSALLVKNTENGDIIAMINGKDVTKQREEERKKREALRDAYEAANRANNAKSDFLARMSHDIRTPMNAILGMTAIATTHLDDTERIKDCLNKISVSGRHLLGLINEVLDMSKIESGKIDLQEEPLILSEVVDSILDICKPLVQGKHHEFIVSIKDIEHEKIIGDSQRIQQALMNLLSNAIKYTPECGRISFTITEKPVNKSNVGCFEFIVEDNGIGMSREFQKKIFQPFERAGDERTLREQGTGLGLTIARNIIQMMNGTIEFESEQDKGTRFTATIFLKLQEHDSDDDTGRFKDLKILVADDDEMSCMSACNMLTELGMKAEWVLSGKEAVDRVVSCRNTDNAYYAVMLDWKMPGLDGIASAKELRKCMGEDLIIIMLTAYDWSEIEEEAKKAGINAFIGKPFFKSRLAYVFGDLLNNADNNGTVSSIAELKNEDFSGHRVLLAEDNDMNAEIVEEIFRMIGLEVDRVRNGREALDVMLNAEDNIYEIVFMDIQMPVMNGYEAARSIRSIGKRYTDEVPIIAMTANAFAEDIQQARAAGMNEHIAKPLDFLKLKATLGKWLKKTN